ncbi:WYL domain-containing protein [Aeromicrobium senzhongii]|uniref:WYL domain-containing protein n=1 Tax=Aeromicrobium senzhongii TaxID=2663859 RepID=A0ABX6SPC8_9ACTN|nr:WYL domain-containing protein [Aeromicrobium senzhongii]MTB87071.1 WYL domain-containing protein [Aeromicrobium senzhongii]QNL93112.1 WYL domain-containing protein [Aeromicrobium senzhongii]
MNPSLKQVVRMLAMVPYLQSNQGIPLADLAREFNIKPAQAQRELEIMMLTGWGEFHGELIDFDVTALQDEGVVYIRDAEFMSRPLRVSRSEAAALMVALRTLRQSAAGDQAALIDSALAKLAEAAGTDVATSVDVLLPEVDPDVQTAVAEALAGQRQLQMVYANETRDEQTERTVDPHRAFTQDGHRYLSAWCHKVEADRLFRVDRIVAATVLDAPVTTEAGHRTRLEDLFPQGPDTPSIVVEIEPSAVWVLEQYRMDVLQERPDGSVRARLFGSDPSWLLRVVMRAGGGVHVVEPAGFAAEVRDAARSALAAYDGTSSV